MKKWIWLAIAAIVVVVATIVVLTLVFDVPDFKMNANGELYGVTGSPMEIPKEFDGIARGFADSMAVRDFYYDGSLRDFVKYHSWVFRESYYSNVYNVTVECNDYTLEFPVNGHSLGVAMMEGENGVYRGDIAFNVKGGTDKSFSSVYDLRSWLGLDY